MKKTFWNESLVFGLFLFYSFLVFAPFLSGQQRVHDSYLVELYRGYDFMIRGLFQQGRIVSSWFYRILETLNPPHTLMMGLSVGASLVFLSMAAYLVYCLFCAYAPVSDEKMQQNRLILAALGSLMLVFNLFISESMLFFENAIMSLGILFALVSATLFVRGGRWNLIGSLLFLILSVFCYQPSSAFFPPVVLLFLGARYGGNLWLFLQRSFQAAALYGTGLFSNFLFLSLISTDVRFVGELRLLENLRNSFMAILRFGAHQLGFMPRYLFSSFLLIFLAILALNCYRQKKLMHIFVCLLAIASLFAATFALLLPMASDTWDITPRAGVAMAGIGGLLLLGIALFSETVRKPVLLVALLFVLLISQRQLDIQRNNYASNQLDMQELTAIVQTIRAYEAYHDITVRRIYFAYDSPEAWSRENLRHYNDLTVSILRVEWMPPPLLRYHLGPEVSIAQYPMTAEEAAVFSEARQRHWFTNGILVFDGETVYIFFP